jgi:hypothetical protein
MWILVSKLYFLNDQSLGSEAMGVRDVLIGMNPCEGMVNYPKLDGLDDQRDEQEEFEVFEDGFQHFSAAYTPTGFPDLAKEIMAGEGAYLLGKPPIQIHYIFLLFHWHLQTLDAGHMYSREELYNEGDLLVINAAFELLDGVTNSYYSLDQVSKDKLESYELSLYSAP